MTLTGYRTTEIKERPRLRSFPKLRNETPFTLQRVYTPLTHAVPRAGQGLQRERIFSSCAQCSRPTAPTRGQSEAWNETRRAHTPAPHTTGSAATGRGLKLSHPSPLCQMGVVVGTQLSPQEGNVGTGAPGPAWHTECSVHRWLWLPPCPPHHRPPRSVCQDPAPHFPRL